MSAITTDTYKLYPSPRNQQRTLYPHEVFVPPPYALVDPPSHDIKGRWTPFGAHRLADGKNGQLVTFELESDAAVRTGVRLTPKAQPPRLPSHDKFSRRPEIFSLARACADA
jgi:hypothetical protein